jgi:hypothetical protein
MGKMRNIKTGGTYSYHPPFSSEVGNSWSLPPLTLPLRCNNQDPEPLACSFASCQQELAEGAAMYACRGRFLPATALPATWEAEFNAPGISSYEEMDWFIEPVKPYTFFCLSPAYCRVRHREAWSSTCSTVTSSHSHGTFVYFYGFAFP